MAQRPLSKSEAARWIAAGMLVEVFHHATLGTFDVSWLRRVTAELARRGHHPLTCAFADVRAEDGADDPHAWLIAQREVDDARVKELTDEQLEDPVVLLLCPPGTNGAGETHLLVDGIHRLAARRARGCADFNFWLVPLAEARGIDRARAVDVPWGKKEVRDGKLVDRQ